MSGVFGLFGSKKKDNKEDIKKKSLETIQNLKTKINEMEEKINLLETKKNHQTEIAKEKLKKGDKIGAKKALAKKKQFDEQIKVHDGALMMMEEQQMMLSNAESLKDVFKTVSEANNAIKEANAGMNIEDLEKIKDDLEVKLYYIYLYIYIIRILKINKKNLMIYLLLIV
jgi:charged multivesicular body protein 4